MSPEAAIPHEPLWDMSPLIENGWDPDERCFVEGSGSLPSNDPNVPDAEWSVRFNNSGQTSEGCAFADRPEVAVRGALSRNALDNPDNTLLGVGGGGFGETSLTVAGKADLLAAEAKKAGLGIFEFRGAEALGIGTQSYNSPEHQAGNGKNGMGVCQADIFNQIKEAYSGVDLPNHIVVTARSLGNQTFLGAIEALLRRAKELNKEVKIVFVPEAGCPGTIADFLQPHSVLQIGFPLLVQSLWQSYVSGNGLDMPAETKARVMARPRQGLLGADPENLTDAEIFYNQMGGFGPSRTFAEAAMPFLGPKTWERLATDPEIGPEFRAMPTLGIEAHTDQLLVAWRQKINALLIRSRLNLEPQQTHTLPKGTSHLAPIHPDHMDAAYRASYGEAMRKALAKIL
ncbi:hypothetical protein HN748_02940 [Candidatus Peregrinibacteria bacterium]|jgi:hypothetical protein|nr:hypothetical protein [Candidatus Peregrinibacteria bacterium]MBT7483775.1 hypothetical protein [Candidatus Peregrinibacteria bacterium]MBT7703163.1 hypothetical protein [Candidatus Peregrinibacteria bacterium]